MMQLQSVIAGGGGAEGKGGHVENQRLTLSTNRKPRHAGSTAYGPVGYPSNATSTLAPRLWENQRSLRDLLTEAGEHRCRGDHAAAQYLEALAVVGVRHG